MRKITQKACEAFEAGSIYKIINKIYKINQECIDAINEGRDVPARIKDFSIKYIKTDGWRGYHEAVPTKKSGWVKYGEGWVTGNWSDAGDNSSDNVEKELDRKAKVAKECEAEMIVIFLPTSNVFSTAYDVFTRQLNNK